jgi:hypothetical protein
MSPWLREGRSLGILEDNSRPMPNPFFRLEDRAPSYQTAVNLFRDRWASDLSEILGVSGSGPARLFTQDKRPEQLANSLGKDGRIDGMTVLELGPLEAAHTWFLEKLGANDVPSRSQAVERSQLGRPPLPIFLNRSQLERTPITQFFQRVRVARPQERAQGFRLVPSPGYR